MTSSNLDSNLIKLVTQLGASDYDDRARAASALVEANDPRVVELLIDVLDNENAVLRQHAVSVLGQIGDVRAVRPLITAMDDADDEVRGYAAWALGTLGNSLAVERLVAALDDQTLYVRQRAAWALGKIGNPRAVEPLVAAWRGESENAQIITIGALIDIGQATVMPLLALLQGADMDRFWLAAQVLGHIGDHRAIAPISKVLRDTYSLSDEEIHARLRKLGFAPDVPDEDGGEAS